MEHKNLAGFCPNPENGPKQVPQKWDPDHETVYQSLSVAVRHGGVFFYYRSGRNVVETARLNLAYYTAYVAEYRHHPVQRLPVLAELAEILAGLRNHSQCTCELLTAYAGLNNLLHGPTQTEGTVAA